MLWSCSSPRTKRAATVSGLPVCGLRGQSYYASTAACPAMVVAVGGDAATPHTRACANLAGVNPGR